MEEQLPKPSLHSPFDGNSVFFEGHNPFTADLNVAFAEPTLPTQTVNNKPLASGEHSTSTDVSQPVGSLFSGALWPGINQWPPDDPAQPSTVGAVTQAELEASKRSQKALNQKRYHERKKQRAAEIEGTLEAMAQEADALRLSNKALEDHNAALSSIVSYKEGLLASIQNVVTSVKGSVQTLVTWGQDRFTKKLDWFLAMHPNQVSDSLLRRLLASVTWDEFLLARERRHLQARELIRKWNLATDPAEKKAYEAQFAAMANFRFRNVRVMHEVNPELWKRFFSTFLIPAGKPTDPIPGINPAMVAAYDDIAVNEDQYKQMKNHWEEYKAEVMVIHEELQQVTRNAALAADGDYSGIFKPPILQQSAQDYLTTLNTASQIAYLNKRELHAFQKFDLGCWKVFNGVQLTLLMLSIYPNIVDPIQFCQVMEARRRDTNENAGNIEWKEIIQ